MNILGFFEGLLVRLVGALLIVVGSAIAVILFLLGILFLITASIVYILTGANWFRFTNYFYIHSQILIFYGIELLITNKWFSLKKYAADEYGIGGNEEQVDYE